MNKTQLIEAIAREANISRGAAKRVMDSFVNAAVSALRKGDKLSMPGFGIFSVLQKPARLGRNPRTGAPVKIAAKRTVKFRATLELD